MKDAMDFPKFIRIPEGQSVSEFTSGFVVEFEETQAHFDCQEKGDKRGFIIIDGIQYHVRWNEQKMKTKQDAEDGKTYLESSNNDSIYEVTSQKRVLPKHI